jgi:predicted CoA-binding protein
MAHEDPADVVEGILRRYRTITVVGVSNHPSKAAHSVPAHMQRHGWRIVPVNPRGGMILGEQAYPTLADVPEPIGLVNVFRPSEQTADVARQAAAVGASALWLQLAIVSEDARRIAQDAGMTFVQDRCLLIEQRRLGLDAPPG